MTRAHRAALTALTVLSALLAIVPAASADRTFSLRYQTIDRADSVLVANTLMTCSGSGCNAVRNGTDTSMGNGDFTEANVNADSDATTFSSSSANLALPVGAVVKFAGLYWGADTTAGTSGSAAPTPASNGTMKFRTPALAGYTDVTASVVDTDSQRTSRYQGFADVTALVQAGGAGTYWGANVQAGTGQDRYAGWSLAVVYTDPSKSIQQVGVYDGLTSLVAATRPSVTIPLDSFQTPASGTVNAKVGLVAWEGDADISSETATLNGFTLTDAVNGTTNQFNSTIARAGAHVTAKSPNYVNQLGIDADEITANGFIPNSATSTTLALGTSQDTYLPGVVTLVNDTYLQTPANTVAPSITGTTTDRSVLTASPGTWTGAPAPTYTYQWRRCNAAGASCVDIASATASTYTLTATDVGSTIRVVVTGTNTAGNATATAPQTAVIAALAPFVTAAPTLSGTTQQGSVLTLSQGTWDGTPTITYARSWQRCNAAGASCVAIAGQTGTTYTLTATDVGSTIRGVVTATNAAGSTPATTVQSAVIAATPPVNTAVPTLSGTARDGSALTTTNGTWTGTPTITFTYQWQRCNAAGASCTDIPGAAASSYTAVPADIGGTLRSRVTGTNAAGNSSAVSAVSAVVAAAPPVNTVLPVISGTARDGQTLSATAGTWTGSPTITYAYQWQRCDGSGAACLPIPGASAATYLLTPADVAGTTRVVVTATNTAGSAQATSAASAIVVPTLPVNTALPVISGTLTEGSTVAASTGTWTGTPTITYAHQWRRCNAAGASCADIPSATASTYTLVAADVGGTLRVVVTATNGAGSTPATSNAASAGAAGPVNTVAPAISGTPTDGQTLTATNGTWTGSATITFARQWQRCDAAGANCAAIPGETGTTYTLAPADVGGTIRVRVTATNGAGSAQATSDQTAIVAADPPANTALPVVSGTARDGQVLSSTTGSWTGTPTVSLARQWVRCDSAGDSCADIPDETGPTYALTAADIGSTIRVRVTGTNAGGSTSASSAATAVVAPDPPVNTAPPVISGTVEDGQTLSASTGTWTGTAPITYDFQWLVCDGAGVNCAEIAGATAATYDLVPGDVGATIRVRVTATNAAGDADASSDATAEVAPTAPVLVFTPEVTGTMQDGGTLTATAGTWTGTPTISYAYQWRRCDETGGGCADLAGETGTTYDLTPDDVGARIRVRVTATNAGGSASAQSDPTNAIDPDAPFNVVIPQISGTVTDGETLSATTGGWSGTPVITFAFQWERCDAGGSGCADILGATDATYAATAADVDATLRVRVSGTNVAGSSDATSDPTTQVAPAPPANTDLPVITGTTQDGRTLSATTGDWTGTPVISHAFQWERCDASGSSCADIPGATDATYDLTADDVDATLRVVVTATNAAGAATAESVPTAQIAADPPVNTVIPAITGTVTDGETLTADDGTWTGTAVISFTYQWERCDAGGSGCADIPGATDATYDLTADDVDATLRVVVTAANAGGDASAESDPTQVAGAAAPSGTGDPSISGTTTDGETLTADVGTWSGTPTITFAHQWRRCDSDGSGCADIAGATDGTYILTPDDIGSRLRVVVTGSNAGGSADATSPASAVVAAIPPTNDVLPAIGGTATDGEALTADTGTWSGSPTIIHTFQWRRCDASGAGCADIPGATDPMRDVTPADIGGTLRVVVTGTNAGGSSSATSDPTGTVAAVAPVAGTPTISGVPGEGETLASAVGTWTGSPTITFARQWLRCDAAGDACAEIPGATDQTYDVTADDVGGTLRVRVTGSNAGGDDTATSAPTAVVTAAPAPPSSGTPPAVTGTPREEQTLTAGDGTWTGTGPITLTRRWQRCDAAGTGCVDIPGATGATYDLVAADVGSTIRVVVTATGPSASASAASPVTAVIQAKPRPEPEPKPQTPAPAPSPVAPASVPASDDLGIVDGGLLNAAQCRQVVTGLGFRRLNAPGIGAIRLRTKADGAVAPDAPLGLALSAPARKIRSVKLQLDGRALRTTGNRGRWTAAVAPKAFADGDTHTLLVTATPRKGAARTMTETIRTAPCATRYTAGQWRTNVGTGLRLRVDSRTALSSVTFPLPAALAGGGALKARKGLGRLRIVQSGGARTILQLGATTAPRGVLLASSAAGSPSVTVSGRTIVVRGLPAGTGIVEVTLYRTGSRLLGARPALQARAVGTSGAQATLKTRLQRVTGR